MQYNVTDDKFRYGNTFGIEIKNAISEESKFFILQMLCIWMKPTVPKICDMIALCKYSKTASKVQTYPYACFTGMHGLTQADLVQLITDKTQFLR